MGYESLSAVIVLAVLVILMAIWLPKRTVKGMKQVVKHQEDRFSTSLHLVDATSGTRFSDDRTPKAKGATMPSGDTHSGTHSGSHGGVDRQYIAHVRELRRAAVRRRQILAGILIALTLAVFGLAFAFDYSPLFALVPAALLAVVCALGANASRQARAWEAKVKERQEKEAARKAQRAKARREAQLKAAAEAQRQEISGAQSGEQSSLDTPTDVMEQREIRRVIHDAQLAKAREIAARAAERAASGEAADSGEHAVVEETIVEAVAPAGSCAGSGAGSASAAQDSGNGSAQRNGSPARSGSAESAAAAQDEADDATNEISTVGKSSVDLISFSLGSPRNVAETPHPAPESLEIKSTKQVAKAVPNPDGPEDPAPSRVDLEEIRRAQDASTRREEVSVSAQSIAETAAEAAEESAPSFHESERASVVDAPDASEESLGGGVDVILARRGN